jgi:hypothetical protein
MPANNLRLIRKRPRERLSGRRVRKSPADSCLPRYYAVKVSRISRSQKRLLPSNPRLCVRDRTRLSNIAHTGKIMGGSLRCSI